MQWPERFPILRVLFALVAVPLLIFAVVSMVGNALNDHLAPGKGRPPLPALLFYSFLDACVLSWPQIIAALVLGVPAAYLLYRTRQSGWLAFIAVGMVCEPVGFISFEWVSLVSREAFMQTFGGIPLLMALGAFTGGLIRVFMLFPLSRRRMIPPLENM